MNYGYPKIQPDFWISINQFLDIQKSVEYWVSIILFWIMDILKYNSFKVQKNTNLNILIFPIFGYPKIQLRISKNRIMDIS